MKQESRISGRLPAVTPPDGTEGDEASYSRNRSPTASFAAERPSLDKGSGASIPGCPQNAVSIFPGSDLQAGGQPHRRRVEPIPTNGRSRREPARTLDRRPWRDCGLKAAGSPRGDPSAGLLRGCPVGHELVQRPQFRRGGAGSSCGWEIVSKAFKLSLGIRNARRGREVVGDRPPRPLVVFKRA